LISFCLFCHFTAQDLAANSNVQDAFVIAVEKQARERLERLSALKKIKPVDMTKLSQQVNTNKWPILISAFFFFCPPHLFRYFIWYLLDQIKTISIKRDHTHYILSIAVSDRLFFEIKSK
jgi:hypothetical protein